MIDLYKSLFGQSNQGKHVHAGIVNVIAKEIGDIDNWDLVFENPSKFPYTHTLLLGERNYHRLLDDPNVRVNVIPSSEDRATEFIVTSVEPVPAPDSTNPSSDATEDTIQTLADCAPDAYKEELDNNPNAILLSIAECFFKNI